MVRFLCFPARIHYHRSKKSVQQSEESMHKSVEDSRQDQAPNVSSNSSSPNPVLLIAHDSNLSSGSAEQITSSDSFECYWKSEGVNSSFSPEINSEVLQMAHLKKSRSLGSGLDREGRVACDDDTEDEIDQGLSCADSHEKNFNRMFDASDHDGSAESFDPKDPEMNLFNQTQETLIDESFQTNADLVHNKSIFSIGDLKQLEQEGHEDFTTQVSGEHVGDSGNVNIPDARHMIVKSSSLPNLRFFTTVLGEGLPTHGFIGHRSRSFGDLHSLDAGKREFFAGDDGLSSQITLYRFGGESSCHNISQTSHLLVKEFQAQKISGEDCVLSNPSGGSYDELANQEREHNFESEKGNCENQSTDGYDSVSFSGIVKDWTVPETYRADTGKALQHESAVHRWDDIPCKEFHNQRIEEWISKIDLQNTGPVQELGECSCSSSTTKLKKSSNAMGSLATAKFDARITPGMEVANSYISSLTAMSSSAQMANLGMVVIPVLSAFVSVRVLNLSGNSIVRITAGALPRGLHMLNLSKNNISTIEGLRELTRLRVLNLSYNRIFRIGHGLASCSSLKELYLAGNKIGEAEGLHRLLKLNVLDLRFNKISTAKSLGQLAANYSCLQSINLEGNPAEKNIGDEQLKKYLLNLLPHLVYFNKQSIRNSSSKDVTDRPTRSIASHQYDRSVRAEHKIPRKGTVASHKPSSLSNHGRLGQAVSSPKRSKDRQRRLPPSDGSRGTTHHQQNIASNLLSLRSEHSIRRSRSEGTLGSSQDTPVPKRC